MSASSYLAGVSALALVVGPWIFTARRVVLAHASGWDAALRALATAVVAVGGLVVSAEVVGSIQLFRRVPLAIVSVAVAVVTARVVPRRSPTVWPRGSWRDSSVPGKLALGAACVTLAQWSLGAWDALRHGIADVDSVAYHLPQAARFVQDHNTTALHLASANAGSAYYPANSELLHAIGMVTLRSDIVSTFLTVALLPLGMLAAFCIGRRLGSGPASVVGFCVLVLAPILAADIGGSGYNDFTAIGFFLAACAFALRVDDEHRRVAVVLAGLAAGLALGTKLTLLPPVGGLTLTLWWVLRHRTADVARYTVAVALGGAYWYARNLLQVGNPIPSLDLGVFSAVPMKLVARASPSVADYLGRGDFVRHIAPGALERFFGHAWPLILLLVAASVAAWLIALRRHDVAHRAVLVGLTLTVALSVGAYVVEPTTAGDANGFPFLFVYNLRYVLPAFIPAFVLLPGLPALRRRQLAVTSAGIVLLALTLASEPRVEARALAIAVVLVALIVATMTLPSSVRRAALAVVVFGAVVGGLPLVHRYERTRFADTSTPRGRLFAWGRTAPPDARVALVGLALQYPFDGPHFETRVNYLGEKRAHHEFTNITTCDKWRTALRRGKYDFVIAEPPDRVHLPKAAAWTTSLPAARTVVATRAGIIVDVRRVTAWPACS